MSPRRKVLLGILVTSVTWMVVTRALLLWTVLPSYERLEREDTRAHVDRARPRAEGVETIAHVARRGLHPLRHGRLD